MTKDKNGNKLTVGDVVKAVTDHYGVTTEKNNWSGTITEILSNGNINCITLTPYAYKTDQFSNLNPNHFVKISNKKAKEEIKFMKLSTISEHLVKNKNVGLQFMALCKKKNITNIIIRSNEIVPEIEGFSLNLKCGGYNPTQSFHYKEINKKISKWIGKEVSCEVNSTLPQQELSNYFIQHKDKNAVEIIINPFHQLNNIPEEKHMEYINWVFKTIINPAFSRMKIIPKEIMLKKQLVEAFIQKNKEAYEEKQNKLNGLIQEIENYREVIINRHKDIELLLPEIQLAKKNINKTGKQIQKEISNVLKLPFIKSIEYKSNHLAVNVGKIFIDDIYIGTFIIKIYLTTVKFENMDNTKDGYQHPHVTSGGTACFGGREQQIINLLKEYNLQKLLFSCYQFLKSYNEESPFHELENWKYED